MLKKDVPAVFVAKLEWLSYDTEAGSYWQLNRSYLTEMR